MLYRKLQLTTHLKQRVLHRRKIYFQNKTVTKRRKGMCLSLCLSRFLALPLSLSIYLSLALSLRRAGRTDGIECEAEAQDQVRNK